MSNEFERENRYIVLKRDHLAGLDDQLQARLKPAIDEAIQIMPRLDCLVVESDWPEYEPTWAAIEARVTGKPAEKNLGEPVELPNRKLHVHQGLSHTDAKVDGWNACLDEIAELGPLYSHPAPGQGEPVAWFRDGDEGREYCEKPFTTDWEPLYTHADPGEVTLQQIMRAYEYAESHPHKYLRGTTNWFAAVAWHLNKNRGAQSGE